MALSPPTSETPGDLIPLATLVLSFFLMKTIEDVWLGGRSGGRGDDVIAFRHMEQGSKYNCTTMLATADTDKLRYPPGLLAPHPRPELKKNQAGSPCCFPGCFSFVHKSWLKQTFENGHVVYYGGEHEFGRLLTCSMVTEGDENNEHWSVDDYSTSPRESMLSSAETVVDTGSAKESFSSSIGKVPPPAMSSVESTSPRTLSPQPPVASPLPQHTAMILSPPVMVQHAPQQQQFLQQQMPLLPPQQQHPFGFYQQFPALPAPQHHQPQQQQPPQPDYSGYGYISPSKKLLIQRIESGLHSGRFLGTVQFHSIPTNDCPGFLVYLPICWYHLNSVCHFGSKCRHAHERRKNWKVATWTDINWFLNASISKIRELDDDFKHQSAIKRTIDH